MADVVELKHMILSFRVSELQQLLGLLGRSKSGKKQELLQRALGLLRSNSVEIKQAVQLVYRNLANERGFTPLERSTPVLSIDAGSSRAHAAAAAAAAAVSSSDISSGGRMSLRARHRPGFYAELDAKYDITVERPGYDGRSYRSSSAASSSSQAQLQQTAQSLQQVQHSVSSAHLSQMAPQTTSPAASHASQPGQQSSSQSVSVSSSHGHSSRVLSQSSSGSVHRAAHQTPSSSSSSSSSSLAADARSRQISAYQQGSQRVHTYPNPAKVNAATHFSSLPIYDYKQYSTNSLPKYSASLIPPVNPYALYGAQLPVHPDVRMKRLPFYDVLASLLKPTSLLPKGNSKYQEAYYIFHLTPQQANEIGNSRDIRPGQADFQVQVLMRFCLTETTSEQDDMFPHSIGVRVNGKPAPLPNLIPSNRPGVEPKRPNRPVNITSVCRLSPTVPNRVDVTWAAEVGRSFCISLDLVRCVTAETLLQRLRAKNIRHPDHTKAMIKEKMAGDGDSEIATCSLKVSLNCPVSKCRMTIPCRPTTCMHLQCFDANMFLQMNERKAKWVCPVCDRSAHFDVLAIDGYFCEVLRSAPSDVTDINFFDDGTWAPIKEDDKKDKREEASNERKTVVKMESSALPPSPETNQSEEPKENSAKAPECITLDSSDEEEPPAKRASSAVSTTTPLSPAPTLTPTPSSTSSPSWPLSPTHPTPVCRSAPPTNHPMPTLVPLGSPPLHNVASRMSTMSTPPTLKPRPAHTSYAPIAVSSPTPVALTQSNTGQSFLLSGGYPFYPPPSPTPNFNSHGSLSTPPGGRVTPSGGYDMSATSFGAGSSPAGDAASVNGLDLRKSASGGGMRGRRGDEGGGTGGGTAGSRDPLADFGDSLFPHNSLPSAPPSDNITLPSMFSHNFLS